MNQMQTMLTALSGHYVYQYPQPASDFSVSQLSVPALNTLKVKQSQCYTMRRDCSYNKHPNPLRLGEKGIGKY